MVHSTEVIVDPLVQRHEPCIFQFETGRSAVNVPRKRGRPKGSVHPTRTKNTVAGLRGTFDFVLMNGQSKVTDKDTRKIIRRRAMINYGQPKKRKTRDNEYQEYMREISILPEISGADPFNNFSVHIEPYMQDLFKFYITTGWKAFYSVEKYTSFNPMIDYWLEMAMSDSAFFHTLIGCADSYISPKGFKRNRPATIKHLNEAISIVNKRIEREEIPTDATLVVVATMACVEKSRGIHDNWVVHMKGLKQLVDLRGGISTLESQPLLMNKLYRADLSGSLDAVTNPYFSNGGITMIAPVEKKSLNAGFAGLTTLALLDISLILCIETLTDALILKKNLVKTRDHVDAATLRYLVTTTQYTLLSHEFSDWTNEAIRLALIMLSSIIVNEDVQYYVYDMLVAKLWEFYESHIRPLETLDLSTDLKLWVFSLASICAGEEVLETKCVRELRRASLDLEVREWDGVEQVLRSFLWNECLGIGKLRALYEGSGDAISE